MKKVKKMLKLPALALMCFGLALPLTVLGSGDDQVSAKNISGVEDIADDYGYNVFGDEAFSLADHYTASGLYGGENLDLSGDGEFAESGLVTAAEWTFDRVGTRAAPAAYYSVGDNPFAEYATETGKDALLGGEIGESDLVTVAGQSKESE